MNIKDLFDKAENGTLNYDQFMTMVNSLGDGKPKFVDLTEGKYVSTSKYDADLKSRDTTIGELNAKVENLNSTITTRDTDLASLQQQLADAGQSATKLAELNQQFTTLQNKYESDTKAYETKMAQQRYEFAVREFANSKHFSSNAAKRDFTSAMLAKGLQMDGDKIIGGEDFVTMYSKDNSDAFYVEPPKPVEPAPAPTPAPAPVPEIIAPTPGPVSDDGESGFQFNFTGVRPHN